MRLESPDFLNNTNIPIKYTCLGENISPELNFVNVPKETQSLVLTMTDIDSVQGIHVHWVRFNIAGNIDNIKEGKCFYGLGGSGTNGSLEYYGPCPPSGTHRYVFKLYALNNVLELMEGAKIDEVEESMQKHILAEAMLVGLYSKE